MESKKKYETKRIIKKVSFNKETDSDLLTFANDIDFSKWVKKQISKELMQIMKKDS